MEMITSGRLSRKSRLGWEWLQSSQLSREGRLRIECGTLPEDNRSRLASVGEPARSCKQIWPALPEEPVRVKPVIGGTGNNYQWRD